jgi:hypothetical protein
MLATRRSAVRRTLATFFLTLFVLGPAAAAVKVKIVVDNANIKATPEIGSQTLANAALNTILDVELKQGEWYKVTMTRNGSPVSGYIHELLVEEVVEGETQPVAPTAAPMKSQGEISAEIELDGGEQEPDPAGQGPGQGCGGPAAAPGQGLQPR